MLSGSRRTAAMALLVAVAAIAFRFVSMPRSIWELDEVLFTEGVRQYQPLVHHPHPPGYPVTIALGKIVQPLTGDPFRALQWVSALASGITAAALFLLIASVTTSLFAALGGALFFSASAADVVHGSLALSDPPALMFLALALLALPRIERSPHFAGAAFGTALSLSIGCRPQLAIVLLPFAIASLIASRSRRATLHALIAFTLTSLAWFVPLAVSVGGLRQLLHYESAQAGYVAAHDAAMSRALFSTRALVARFVMHPFGVKWLALPVLLLAAAGAVPRGTRRIAAPLLFLGLAQLVFCLAVADPADGVRYMLPAVLAWAALAGLGLLWLSNTLRAPWLPLAIALPFAVGSFLYCRPLLQTRAATLSPIDAAAEFARARLPRGSVLGCEPALCPHLRLLLREFRVEPMGAAVSRHVDQPHIVVHRFVDRYAEVPGRVTFEWPRSDAYEKLTRNLYRVVTIAPLPPASRYASCEGVFALEQAGGHEWRWLAQRALLRLPAQSATEVRVTLSLPVESALEANRASVTASSGAVALVDVRRGVGTTITLPLRRGGESVEIRSAAAYVPARSPGQPRDTRSLAVQLRALESR